MFAFFPMHFAYTLTRVCIHPYACCFVYIRMHAYVHALIDNSSVETAPKTKKKVRKEEEHEEGKSICFCIPGCV